MWYNSHDAKGGGGGGGSGLSVIMTLTVGKTICESPLSSSTGLTFYQSPAVGSLFETCLPCGMSSRTTK